MNRKTWHAARPMSLPIVTAFVVFGISYGLLMVSKGFAPWIPVLMAAVIYAGSMEFVTIELLLGAFHPVSAFFLAIMVGARHLFYGISMIEDFEEMGSYKPYLIYTLCDETFSVYIAADVPPDVEKRDFYLCVSFANHLAWVLGSAIGAFGGRLVAFDTRGLDFILTAMFFSIFLDQWEEAGDHTPAMIGLGASLFALLVFGKTGFILPALALILVGLVIYERRSA